MVWRNAPHPPRRLPNASVRGREYLTDDEVKLLRNAAKGAGRYGLRDGTLILVSYRHGLRVSEATDSRRGEPGKSFMTTLIRLKR